jgi:rhodanese-related sulfurtransferase
MKNSVTEFTAAASAQALAHYSAKLAFETDCWDVHAALQSNDAGFVLLDVRSSASFSEGHVPGAINLPHAKIIGSKLSQYPTETMFVVYCAGPHCNGADRAALRLAQLGRTVKIMIGGITGWLDEGFDLARAQEVA